MYLITLFEDTGMLRYCNVYFVCHIIFSLMYFNYHFQKIKFLYCLICRINSLQKTSAGILEFLYCGD